MELSNKRKGLFSNEYYKPPYDLMTQTADFYAISFMWDMKNIIESPTESISPYYQRISQDFLILIDQAYGTILETMGRDTFLRLRRCIMSELTNSTQINPDSLNDKEKKLVEYYSGLRERTSVLDDVLKRPVEDDGVILFKKPGWKFQFGGDLWYEICVVTQELRDAKGEDVRFTLDHVIDLHHNTGTVFNKLPGYKPDFKRLLDIKREAESPMDFKEYCSYIVKQMILYFEKARMGYTEESFIPTEERNIIKRGSPQDAFEYMSNRPERNSEIEKIIGKDAELSYLYTIDKVKGRFEEGEKAILSDPVFKVLYLRFLRNVGINLKV